MHSGWEQSGGNFRRAGSVGLSIKMIRYQFVEYITSCRSPGIIVISPVFINKSLGSTPFQLLCKISMHTVKQQLLLTTTFLFISLVDL